MKEHDTEDIEDINDAVVNLNRYINENIDALPTEIDYKLFIDDLFYVISHYSN
jgi:hypothetical protein